MRSLHLDIATLTGWSVQEDSRILASGTWTLATEEELIEQRKKGSERTLDVRFRRLIEYLSFCIREYAIERITFEDVQFVRAHMSGQLWPSLRAAIWTQGILHPQLLLFAVPSSTLKAFATGNGHSGKEQMAHALAAAWPGAEVVRVGNEICLRKPNGGLADDNEVDALWLARLAQAVDQGRASYLAVSQRKKIRMAEKRQRRREKRERLKLAKRQAAMEAKARKLAIKNAVRAIGRCCGVYRRPSGRSYAACPKCARKVRLSLALTQTTSGSSSTGFSSPECSSGSVATASRQQTCHLG